MTGNEDFLREKAKLLIARERELLALKRKHKRLALWLALAQRLPQLVGPKAELDEVCDHVSDQMIAVLDLHIVAFFTIDGTSLRAIGRASAALGEGAIELEPSAAALIEGDQAGTVDGRSEAHGPLCRATGLHRFLWQRLTPAGALPLLFAAGYDRERAQFFAPFDADDLAHFANTAHQLTLLLANNGLVRELERDKDRLRQFNVELERQVDERTSELAATNRKLEEAFQKLSEKEQRLQEDIEEARLFQQKILPEVPGSAQADFATAYLPLERVGGDVFDVIMLDARRFRVFLADATGHGVQAAMRTILIKTEFERLRSSLAGPHLILQELNRRLVSRFPGGETMCTACCVDVLVDESGAASVTYANAGSAPLLHWSDTVVAEIHGDTPFLGIGEPTWPEPIVFRMTPGDVLVVATDGLTEQRNGDGVTFEDVIKTTPMGPAASAADWMDRLLRGFAAFRGSVPLTDDVTVVALRLPVLQAAL